MAARKPRKSTARRTTATAKIRVHTDENGRKVYTIVGTKKFAYTLAKAKEIASKSKAGKKRAASSKKSTALTTTRKRKTTKRKVTTTKRRTTGAKRNAKGQFVKAGRKTARRTTRRNPVKRLAGELADRRDRIRAADTHRVEQNAMYEVYSTLSVAGRKFPSGLIEEVEGKHDGLAVANAFLERFGIKDLVYREDRGHDVVFRGKVGSGVKGVLDILAISPEEALRGRGSSKAWRRLAKL